MKLQKQNRMLAALLCSLLMIALVGCVPKDQPVSTSFSIEGQSTQRSTDYLVIDLSVPILSGFDAAETINKQIEESVNKAKDEVEDAASMIEQSGYSQKAGLNASYLYSKSGELVSLWIMMANYMGGAHGFYWVEPYTFNTSTNEIYHFGDLFQEGNASAALITDKIIERINNNPEYYFPSAEETVKTYKNDYQFYINGNQLTVFFPLYDIAPYAGGIQFFDFNAEELKNILKPEIYDAVKNASPIDTTGTILEH